MFKIQLPSRKECLWLAIIWSIYFVVVGLFVGLRPDNVFLAVLFITLFCYNKFTRALAVAMIPFVIFGISYDWMRVYPNYMVNPIDVRGINDAERALFGIATTDGVLTPNEFFALHNHPVADFLSGIFYLMWVPGPIALSLYLLFSGKKDMFIHFSWAFLFVNLIGFVGYYVHPAAPPWYVMEYGYEPILNTPGNVAGLARFDALVGMDVFQGIYGKNANVFAAVPSLHSAYMLIAAIYAVRSRSPRWICVCCFLLAAGIWWTAVYTAHHYLIDVLLGITTAIVGVFLFEALVKYSNAIARFFQAYKNYIQFK